MRSIAITFKEIEGKDNAFLIDRAWIQTPVTLNPYTLESDHSINLSRRVDHS